MLDRPSIEYITITEAAKRIGVCRATVSRAAATGIYAQHKVYKRSYLIWQRGRLVLASEEVPYGKV